MNLFFFRLVEDLNRNDTMQIATLDKAYKHP